jgi:hypothetical protein
LTTGRRGTTLAPMSLTAGCPRCASAVTEEAGTWRCADHGSVPPLWRSSGADYEQLADHLVRGGTVPSFVPWPLAAGWAITDFGCVARPEAEGRACFVTCAGPSELEGVIEVTLVTEEPGVGLGARCAGLVRTDPGAEIGDGPPAAKVRVDGHPISLWQVSTSDADVDFDRTVLAGEAYGRWLWMVLRPPSAALLLRDEWILLDLAGLGPSLIDLPFADTPPAW